MKKGRELTGSTVSELQTAMSSMDAVRDSVGEIQSVSSRIMSDNEAQAQTAETLVTRIRRQSSATECQARVSATLRSTVTDMEATLSRIRQLM